MKKYSLILIDRDGVINRKPNAHNYVTSWKDFKFLPKVKLALSLLTKAGYKIAIITNQKAIGKGIISEKELESIHQRMIEEIEKFGGKILKIYYCPHAYECNCRKPNPYLVFRAMKELNSYQISTVMIGDFFADYETSKNSGIDFIYIDSESDEREEQTEKFKSAGIKPLTFSNLYDAALFLTK